MRLVAWLKNLLRPAPPVVASRPAPTVLPVVTEPAPVKPVNMLPGNNASNQRFYQSRV